MRLGRRRTAPPVTASQSSLRFRMLPAWRGCAGLCVLLHASIACLYLNLNTFELVSCAILALCYGMASTS